MFINYGKNASKINNIWTFSFKNFKLNTCNRFPKEECKRHVVIQNMCKSTVYVISKAST